MLRTVLILLLTLILAACNLSGGTTEEETPIPLVTATTQVAQVASATPTTTPTITPSPTATRPVTTCTPRTDWQTYTIVSGDTLGSIARRANTSLDALISGNCLSNPNLISVGQVLRVPNAPVPATVVPTATATTPSQPTGCLFYPTTTEIAYIDQSYVYPAGPLTLNQRYSVTGRTAFGYRLALPNNVSGWVQIPMGGVEGTGCGDVPILPVAIFAPMGEEDYRVCYWLSESSRQAFFDQAMTFAAEMTTPRRFYFVDGRTPTQVRIIPNSGIPLWVNESDGRIDGSCGAVPDVSVATTYNSALMTYEGGIGRYRFDYPGNWVIRHNSDGLPGGWTGTISFMGMYPNAMGYPQDVVSVSWVEHPVNTTQPAEQFAHYLVEQIRAANGRIQVTRDVQPFMTEYGMPGWSFQTSGVNAPATTYIFSVEGVVMELTVQGNEGLAAAVIRTLRPAPDAQVP